MAQNTGIDVPASAWTLLTDANVTEVTLQNIGGHDLFLNATVGAGSPPAGTAGFLFSPAVGDKKMVLADVFLGVSGANRVWAYGTSGGRVMVSHA